MKGGCERWVGGEEKEPGVRGMGEVWNDKRRAGGGGRCSVIYGRRVGVGWEYLAN